MKPKAKKHLMAVRPYEPGRPIEEVQRELGLRRVIKLASNENPYPPSERVIRAIMRAAQSVNRYPDDNCYELRRDLARRLGVKPGQLIFGNGSDEIIGMAVRTFVRSGDDVVIAKPSFLMYTLVPQVEGARIIAVPLKNLSYDLVGMARAVTSKTKLIFIGNPDNPGGISLTQTQCLDFLKHVRQDIVVFWDEAYYQFVKKPDYPDSIKLLKRFPNLIVARTFSKNFGLAGLRLGYGVAAPEMIDLLNRVREPFNVNALAQAAGLACLKDERYYRGLIDEIGRQKQLLYDGFAKLGLYFYPSDTNFILIDTKKPSSVFARKLLTRGIIVRDMNAWGLATFIRVTVGTPPENRKLLAALKSILV